MVARPFPWGLLPPARRAPQLTALRSTLEAAGPVARAITALSDLVGSPVELTGHSLGAELATTLTTSSVALRLEGPDATNASSWWVVLEVEIALVAAVVSRVTRRPPPRVVQAASATPALVGSFAAILAAAVRRAGAAVLVAPLAERAPIAGDGAAVVAGLSAFAFGETTHVRALFPAALLSTAPPPFDAAHLAGLAEVPVTLAIVASRLVASAAEVARIAAGDVWRLGDSWAPGAGPRRVWLCDGQAERALVAALEVGGQVVLRDGVEELSWSPMNEETTAITAVMEAVGEVPVVIRAEIGAATLTAREWSALRTGDVVGLGSKIGGLVTLRVSGVAIAEGELVDLEGEVGVRIRRRLAATSP